jgi:hypothetical protein
MSEHNYNLLGISRQIFKKKNFVIGVTLAAGILSFLFCLLQKNQYTSETIFIVKNPILIDRNYVFRNTSYEHKEFFAIADDVDHIKTIGKSDGLIWHLISKFDLGKVYGVTEPAKLFKKVKGNYKITVEDTKNVELKYKDPDPERAQQIAVAARAYIEEMFLNYFLSTNHDVTEALNKKAAAITDSINILNDSIAAIRARIGNYSQLLPVRGEVVGATSGSVSAEASAGLEQLKQITEIKDQYTRDIAAYRTLVGEYEVMASGKIKVFYVVQDAYVPNKASHPMTLIIVAASILGGLFFSCFLVLFQGFYKSVMNTKEA